MKYQHQILRIHWSQHATNANISAHTGLPPVKDFTRRCRLSHSSAHARDTSTQRPTLRSWPSFWTFTWQGLETSSWPSSRSLDRQLRNDTGSVPANLWRQAILRGHGGVTCTTARDDDDDDLYFMYLLLRYVFAFLVVTAIVVLVPV